jgi:hypothetical protein
MSRRLDHLVVCVRDLAQAALDWQTLGFSLTPTGVHPFGTSNRLAMFGNNFLELLAVTDAAAVPPAAPGRFSFAAHNRDFLTTGEGMSMLAMHSADAHADAARFQAHHIGAYAPFDFGRDAVLPGGGAARVEFSLAFATDPAMPGIAFFTCQQRHPPELFWKAEYQRHPNGALRAIEVVMSAPEPAAHRTFLERITESTAELAPGRADGRRARRPDHYAGPGRNGAPAARPRRRTFTALLRRACRGHRSGGDEAGIESQRCRLRG